jgi:hypothetical protein
MPRGLSSRSAVILFRGYSEDDSAKLLRSTIQSQRFRDATCADAAMTDRRGLGTILLEVGEVFAKRSAATCFSGPIRRAQDRSSLFEHAAAGFYEGTW